MAKSNWKDDVLMLSALFKMVDGATDAQSLAHHLFHSIYNQNHCRNSQEYIQHRFQLGVIVTVLGNDSLAIFQ